MGTTSGVYELNHECAIVLECGLTSSMADSHTIFTKTSDKRV